MFYTWKVTVKDNFGKKCLYITDEETGSCLQIYISMSNIENYYNSLKKEKYETFNTTTSRHSFGGHNILHLKIPSDLICQAIEQAGLLDSSE